MFYIKFKFLNDRVELSSDTRTGVYTQLLDWLYSNGYEFRGNLHQSYIKKIHTLSEVRNSSYGLNRFHKFPDDTYFYLYRNKEIENFWVDMLINFGIDKSTISIKNDRSPEEGARTIQIKRFDEFADEPHPITIDRSMKNQFETAVCVTGESGVGKSTLVEDLLDREGHNYEFIIPTSSTTSLLAQYYPNRGSYGPSRLGNLLIKAKQNPNELYTAVFDEMHKPGFIDMINDELLQAISTERNDRKRFISVEGEVAEIYEGKLEEREGNLMIPNNFGFVLITSKPEVIENNPDLKGRIKIANITDANKKDIKTISDLIAECDGI